MNRSIELLWLRVREYFKHPAEDIRQAHPVVPGRLYYNFGYICKAVPFTSAEKRMIDGVDDLTPELHREQKTWANCPTSCLFCDLQKKGLPCPLINTLADGRTVCQHYKYIIIKNQKS